MNFLRYRKIVVLAGLLLILVSLPVALYMQQQEQDLRQEAAEPTVCTTSGADIMLIIDKSGSMQFNSSSSDFTPRMTRAKEAANSFIDTIMSKNTQLPQERQNRVGLSSISTANTNNPTAISKLENPLSTSFNEVKNSINAMTAENNNLTCIDCGIVFANNEIATNGRSGFKKVAILMTDGKANQRQAIGAILPTVEAESYALESAIAGYEESGTVFYTIGLGADVNEAFLKELASQTGGKYYFAPTANDLEAIYQEIEQILAKGAIRGVVFNDLNRNGTTSPSENEPVLSNQQVTLLNGSTDQTIASVNTDNQGEFRFDELCDGAYKTKITIPPGWIQTTPSNNQPYTINILHGLNYDESNFGLAIAPSNTPTQIPPTLTLTPTPTLTPTLTPTSTPTNTPIPPTLTPTSTPVPQATNVSFTLFLHGIGNSGDSVNPTNHSLSNKDPLHTQRTVFVEALDSSENVLAENSGTVIYDAQSGNFKGTVSLGTTLVEGDYLIKIKTDQFLKRQVPGIHSLTPGQTNTLSPVEMINGDVNNDNALNILDYNLIIGCYSDLLPPLSCTDEKKLQTDINDDGVVNQLDYNLFIRELSVQQGD